MPDPNMATLYEWSLGLPWMEFIPEATENMDFLVDIVKIVEECITFEFMHDIGLVEDMVQRKLTNTERQSFRHPLFFEYDEYRRRRMGDCVKDKLMKVRKTGVNSNAYLGADYRLWSGCLMGSEMIAESTMDGINTSDIRIAQSQDLDNFVHRVAIGDRIFIEGIGIAPFFERRKRQIADFDGLQVQFINRYFTKWAEHERII